MEYITGSCVISERAVHKNGEKIFTADDAGVDVSAGSPRPGHSSGSPQSAGFLPAVYQHFNWQYPKFFKMDNLSRLGWAATELLLEGWDAAAYQPQEVAVVLSNASSSLDTDYKYTQTMKEIPSPSVFVYTLPNIVIGEICIRHRFKGENAFFLSAEFDAALLTRYVTYVLEAGIARACITGWVEWLGESFKAALFLIERKETADALPFTAENMDRIFKTSMTCE
jgi:hypothetical protein